MSNDLDELGLRETVLFRPVQVARKLLRVSVGDECSDGDQTAVPLRQFCTFPNIAEQHVVRELHQLGEKSPIIFCAGDCSFGSDTSYPLFLFVRFVLRIRRY